MGTILGIILAIGLVFAMACIETAIFMFVWDLVAVGMLGLATLSFWQAFAVLFVLQLIFKSHTTVKK